jgi:hypothetical protein
MSSISGSSPTGSVSTSLSVSSGSSVSDRPFIGFGGLMDVPCVLSINSSKTFLFMISTSLRISEGLRGLTDLLGTTFPLPFNTHLAHFVAFSPCWSKHSPQDFLLDGKVGSVFSVVTPFIPSKLTKVGNVSFFSKSQCVWVGSMKLEVRLGCQVVNSRSPFNTVVPKDHWRTMIHNVLSDSFLKQANVELSLVGPRCAFLQGSQC